MPQKNAAVVSRVSTDDQNDHGDSNPAQDAWLDKTINELKVNVVLAFRAMSISGQVFPKKHFNDFIETDKQVGIDTLLVQNIDRFARDFTAGYTLLHQMHEIRPLVIHTQYITYDLNNWMDNDRLITDLQFAARGSTAIAANVKRTTDFLLANEKYPGKPPFGYERDDKKVLRRTPWAKDVYNFCYDNFRSTMNLRITVDTVVKQYPEYASKMSRDRILRILTNPIAIGYIRWKKQIYGKDGQGYEAAPWDDLVAIPRSKFDEVQDILNIRKKSAEKSFRDNSVICEELIDGYGAKAFHDTFKKKIRTVCSNCNSIHLCKNGEEEVTWWDKKQGHFKCRECGHDNRFPIKRDIRRLNEMTHMLCRICYSSRLLLTNEEGSEDYKLICQKCGHTERLKSCWIPFTEPSQPKITPEIHPDQKMLPS